MNTASEKKLGWRKWLVVWEAEQQRRFPERDYVRMMLALLIMVLSIIAGFYAIFTGSHRILIFNTILVALIFAQGLIGACVSIRHTARWSAGLTLAALISWFLSIWPSIAGGS